MASGDRWGFDRFVVDARERQLVCDGRVVPLTPRAFSLLVILLGRPGRLCTKAELFDTVWAGRVVTEAALSQAIHQLRTALDDDAGAPRFIATVHGLGFRFIAPVVAAAPGVEAAAPSADPALPGRDAELAQLAQALADARSGHRRLVFVTGEAGIGKTALVEAFLQREQGAADELWLAQGRCIESYGTGDAFLPILEALEQLSPQVGAETLRKLLERYAPAWLAQLPWLAREADPALLQQALAEPTPQRMLLELAHALEVLAAERPVVLWLEDLHWSDPSSLAVLSFLAGRRAAARLLLIGSFRPADAASSAAPLHALALRLEQRGQAQSLALAPLDEGAVKRLLARRLGSAQPDLVDPLGAFVHRRSEGNPLFAVTLVDDLLRRRQLSREDGVWTLKGNLAALGAALPDSLRLLVHEHFEHLPVGDRRLVEAAAVAGAVFSAAAVAAALQADPVEIEDRCAALVQQGRFLRAEGSVSWPDGTVAASFGFLHALYCQGILERVPHARRIEWQRRIGLRQEQAYGDQGAAIAAELAMRFEAARDLERSVRYLQLAGVGALTRCAYPESIALLRHALELVPKLPASQRSRLELDVLLPLGVALMAVKGYAHDDVEHTYARARSLCLLCARPGDLERVLRGQWNVAFVRADLAAAQAIADQLLSHAESEGDETLALDAHTKLGQGFLHLGELAAARRHLERALELCADGQAAGLRAAPRVAIYLSWALWHAGLGTQARQRADEALVLSRDAGSPHSSAFALGYGMILYVLCGELTRALELAPRLDALTSEEGLVYWRQVADFVAGMIRARQGDPATGSTLMRRATQAMRGTGARVGVPYLLCLIAEADLANGATAAARSALEDASALVAASGNALYAAEASRLEGDLALAEAIALKRAPAEQRMVAEQQYRLALGLARAQGALVFELRAAISLARLYASAGEPRRAIELLAAAQAGFSEGFDTHDWVRADALLKELSATTAALAVDTPARDI